MIRKQVYISQDQEMLLKQKAKALSVTEAELVRQALNNYLLKGTVVVPKVSAWEDEKKFIQERIKLGCSTKEQARTWKREDLYDK